MVSITGTPEAQGRERRRIFCNLSTLSARHLRKDHHFLSQANKFANSIDSRAAATRWIAAIPVAGS